VDDAEARFWELCDRATRHDDACFRKAHRENAPDDEVIAEAEAFERSMVEIIEFVEANPERRETFVRCFCDLVQWKRSVPFDLVAFCMRRLRFPEIPELIRRDAESHGRRSAYYLDHMAHWSSINHAYQDFVWEDANRWAYYTARELALEMVPALTQRLTSLDFREQFNAVWALRSIGPPAQSALPALQALLVTAREAGSTNLVNAIGRAVERIQQDEAGSAEPRAAPDYDLLSE
jgi:hypothetical protein